jgi:auxin-responsive protein IAA
MAGLGFEETELRLGLPGGGSDAGDAAAARKRGFEETIDLKLKLEQPASAAAACVEKEAEEGEAEAAAASATGGGNMKSRSPSQSSVVTADDAQPDPEKPRAPKYVSSPASPPLLLFSLIVPAGLSSR